MKGPSEGEELAEGAEEDQGLTGGVDMAGMSRRRQEASPAPAGPVFAIGVCVAHALRMLPNFKPFLRGSRFALSGCGSIWWNLRHARLLPHTLGPSRGDARRPIAYP